MTCQVHPHKMQWGADPHIVCITIVPSLFWPWPSFSWSYKLLPSITSWWMPQFSPMSLPASPSELFPVSISPPPQPWLCCSGFQVPTAPWVNPRSFLASESLAQRCWVNCFIPPHTLGTGLRMSLQSFLDVLSPLLPGRQAQSSATWCASQLPHDYHPNSSRKVHFFPLRAFPGLRRRHLFSLLVCQITIWCLRAHWLWRSSPFALNPRIHFPWYLPWQISSYYSQELTRYFYPVEWTVGHRGLGCRPWSQTACSMLTLCVAEPLHFSFLIWKWG